MAAAAAAARVRAAAAVERMEARREGKRLYRWR
jgi:hypothetical protein